MPARQQFLFPPERPIVDRLGEEFFRSIPTSAGVYKMHDAAGAIIYIGKARNLRQRLRSYRVANPETLSRRHLRLLQRVARIEVELCEDESAALKHEAALIRSHQPKFNRAGVWPGKPQWLQWRCTDCSIEMCVSETAAEGWRRVSAFKWRAHRLRAVLTRLLWLVSEADRRFGDMPCGWINNHLPEVVTLKFAQVDEARVAMEKLFNDSSETFIDWLVAKLPETISPFETAAISEDLEQLRELRLGKIAAEPTPAMRSARSEL